MSDNHFDVLVLGAGPGGYVAAIRAAQLGKSVAVVEEKYWGGVCLNVGCIPSKALLKNAELAYTLAHERDKFGIEGEATMAYGPTHARSRKVSEGIVKGVHYLMKKNKITEIDGWGTLTSASEIDVDGTSYTFDNLILATGATVRMLPGMEVSDHVVTYEEQILDGELPGSIIIGGSGAIGVEFAYVMKNFGVDVTIVEFLDRMVPTEDADVSKELLKHYKKLGVKVMLSTKVENVEDTGSGVRVTVAPADGGESQVIEADKMLAAFGFAPRLEGYGLDAAGVETTERGAIAIDDYGRTNVDQRLRDRRRHRQADAGPHRRGDGDRGGRGHRGRRDDAGRVRLHPARDLLPAADRAPSATARPRRRRRGTTSRRRPSRSRPTARRWASATRSAS